MNYTYKKPRPALTVECVAFGWNGRSLQTLLIPRRLPPFRGTWSLPVASVGLREPLEEAAHRVMQEAVDEPQIHLEQLHTFGAPDRDPRERVVSVAFLALVRPGERGLLPNGDPRGAAWFSVDKLPQLAFDHRAIIRRARQSLRRRIRFEPLGFELLPNRFTLTHVQRLFEVILERTLDKRNFRRKILETDLLTALEDEQTGVAHRRARLYRFDKRRYKQRNKDEMYFAI